VHDRVVLLAVEVRVGSARVPPVGAVHERPPVPELVQVDRARRVILPVPGRIQATLEEHEAIVAALEAHDPIAAKAATRQHLRQLLTFLEPLEEARPDLFLQS